LERKIAEGEKQSGTLAGARGRDAYHRRNLTQARFSEFSGAFRPLLLIKRGA
jgi:hypothetical protein